LRPSHIQLSRRPTRNYETVIEHVGANVDFLKSLERPVLVGYLFNTLVMRVLCLKHEGFHEEREWRAAYFPKRAPSPLMESATEVIGGVPQIVYKCPLDKRVSDVLAELDLFSILDRLIIGPSAYPRALYEAFVGALSAAGVADAAGRVFTSGIPIRS
jgi:hypothetical protein